MNKLLLVLVASLFAVAACDKAVVTGPAPTFTFEGQMIPGFVGTKSRAEVLKELADYRAACKADPSLVGCSETSDKLPVTGTAKTRAEVSAELGAFLAACKAKPAAGDCVPPTGG